jgi:DNA polymerase family B, exonuclease domain
MKRALTDQYGENAVFSPKRLRGGAMDDGDDEAFDTAENEDLFDDELVPSQLLVDTNEEYIPSEVLEEVKKKIPVKDQQRWKRPDLPDDFTNAQDLNFQWIDMDVTTSPQPLQTNPNSSRTDVVGSPTGPVPVLRCYGVDENGHSVATYYHGFTPYAYFAIPNSNVGTSAIELSDSALAEIRTVIDSRLREMSARLMNTASSSSESSSSTVTSLVLGVSHVTDSQSIFGYETPHAQFLKIYVALPTLIPSLKRLMEDGITLPPISNHCENYIPFECNVPYVLRFMVDRNISGAGWITLPASTYTIRSNEKKETHCQVRRVWDHLFLDVLSRSLNIAIFVPLSCLLM